MNNHSLKITSIHLTKPATSYLKNFNLAHINWELNRQEDRHFQTRTKAIPSLQKELHGH